MKSVLVPSFAVAFACGFSCPANALSLETVFADKLIRAHVGREIDGLRDRFERAKEARVSCAMQIARGSAPVECYEVLGLERAWKVLDEPRFRAKRRRLDAACTSAALRLNVPEASGHHDHVSSECLSRVKEARSTRRYRRADTGWSGD